MDHSTKALAFALAVAGACSCRVARGSDPTPEEIRANGKEAYVYGYPMADGYRVQHLYFVDRGHPNDKCPWNQINHRARVNTPKDRTVQTPHSDTPCSQLGLDLRSEPWVLAGRPAAMEYWNLAGGLTTKLPGTSNAERFVRASFLLGALPLETSRNYISGSAPPAPSWCGTARVTSFT